MIIEKAPGKLYVGGEYAVVEPGNTAVIIAIDKFVTATVTENNNTSNKVISEQYQNTILSWNRNGNKMVVDDRENPYQYILSAISITEELAVSMNKKLKNYDININSELDSQNGKKYGLGSSAAVTVATIKAISKLYGLALSNKVLFKLASISHLEVQGNGSLGDVAASVYGGLISYTSFNREWLNSIRRTEKLKYIVEIPWPMLEIKSLKLPNYFKVLIGWSGSPSSTSKLVDQVASKSYQNTKNYTEFLDNSKKCMEKLVEGFNYCDSLVVKKAIKENMLLLKNLSSFSGVTIETDSLNKLCNIANKYNGAAKSSGAGGGDCGIVLIERHENINGLYKEWENNDIIPLHLDIFENIPQIKLRKTV